MYRNACLLGSFVVVAAVAVVLAGCDLLGAESQQNGNDDSLITERAAIDGMEAISGMMSALFDGCGEPAAGETYPDFGAGTYPTGMQVTESAATGESVTLSIAATDITPEAESGEVAPDLTINGDFTIVVSVAGDGDQLTIEMDGSMSMGGADAPFTSLVVAGAVAVIPIVGEELGDPTEMTGTLTVDGEAFDMSRIDLDAVSDDGNGSISIDPAEAHYFTFGYRVEGAVDRPQIVFSDTTEYWDTIDLAGTGALRAAAIDEAGTIVAVGDNGLIYSSADGAAWVDRSVPSIPDDLRAVTVSSTTWIAVGDGVILRSTDGETWNRVWSAPAGERLFAVTEFGPGEWLAAGAPPHELVRSDDDGITWTIDIADPDNRPTQLIRDLFFTPDGDTPWVALTGDPGFPGGIFHGGDTDSDGDMDWTAAVVPDSVFAGAVREGLMVAFAAHGGGVALHRSDDGGDSWTVELPSGSINGYPVDLVTIGNGFLGVTNMGGLVRGSANGSTWQVLAAESYAAFGLVFRP